MKLIDVKTFDKTLNPEEIKLDNEEIITSNDEIAKVFEHFFSNINNLNILQYLNNDSLSVNIIDLIIKGRPTNRCFHERRRTDLLSELTHSLLKDVTQKKTDVKINKKCCTF